MTCAPGARSPIGVTASRGRAQPLQGLVDDDARQPRRKCRFAAELGQRGEGMQVSLLQHVLGIGVITHNTARHAIKAPVVLLDDGADGGLVLAHGPADELRLGRIGSALDLRLHGRPPSYPRLRGIGCGGPEKVPDSRRVLARPTVGQGPGILASVGTSAASD
jgi:hypothetical protein